MSIAVELPELGESVVEGTVARWLVKEGDVVEADQPLVEVTTDKVDAEIPAPAAGVVAKILVAEGDTIEVGAKLALLDPDGQGTATKSEPSEAPTPTAPSPPAPAEAPRPGTAKATPVARRVAEDRGLDLDDISGSGSAGRITKADVLSHGEGDGEPPASPAPAPVRREQEPAAGRPRAAAASRPSFLQANLEEGDRVIPMTPQRKLIAQHMVYSKRTSPHVGTVAEVDMTGIVRLRARHKTRFQETQGVALTYLPFIVHACVRALRENPRLNASVVDDAIVEKRDINIGLAVETEKGLVAPVLRNSDRLSLAGIAAAIEDLSSRARNKRLGADELRGGTFTISNPGRRGNLYGFAIINQPQVGILRMGEIVKRPVVRSIDGEDAIVIRSMMFLALSYDHRAVDGQPANAFLYRVRELLEEADFDL